MLVWGKAPCYGKVSLWFVDGHGFVVLTLKRAHNFGMQPTAFGRDSTSSLAGVA